jgi:hypothetical protein
VIVIYDHKFYIVQATGLIFVDMVRSLVNEKSFKSLSMLQTFLIVSDRLPNRLEHLSVARPSNQV